MVSLLSHTLVGRAVDLKVLCDQLDGARGGGLVLLGEPGVGKSRLVAEAATHATGLGRVVLTGRSVRSRQATPYQPIAEALLSACRHDGLPQRADLIPYRPALGRLLPEWRRPEGASAESTVALGEGVLLMLDALGGRSGALLVIEDLQWADPETLGVLEYIVDHAADISVNCLATVRTEPSAGLNLVRELVARRASTMVELGPLPTEHAAEIACQCLGVDVLPAGLEQVVLRAEGVPLMVEELLAAAVDAGGLVRHGSAWTVRSVIGQVVPRTLADSVGQRMRGVGVVERNVLQVAAILGRNFDSVLLGIIVGLQTSELDPVLDRGVELQLLSIDGGRYQFRHSLTRDAVLNGLSRDARTALAGYARTVLDEAHPGLPDRWCELAANLSVLAGNKGDAAVLLLEVAGRALADGALTTAAAAGERARQLAADDSPVMIAIDEQLIEIAALTGDYEQTVEIGERLLPRLAESSRRIKVHLRIAQAASATARWAAAQERINLARAQVRDRNPATLADLDALAAHVSLGAGEVAVAEAIARRVLVVAEEVDLPEPACQALEVIGRVARKRDLGEAEAAFARQLEIATEHGMTIWMVRATHELGAVDLMSSNRTDRLIRARDLASDTGALSVMATVDLQLAGSALTALDAVKCLDAARRGQLAARRRHLDLVLAVALVMEAWAHAIAGRRSAMEHSLAESTALGRPEPHVAAMAAAVRATYWLLQEERSKAMAAYDAAMAHQQSRPGIEPGSYCSEWAFLRTVQDREGDMSRAAMRVMLPAGGIRSEALLSYGDAIAAGRQGQGEQATAIFASARAAMAAGQRWESLRHLAERLVAECALADGWGDPVEWLTDAAGYFRLTGQQHVERASRSLLLSLRRPTSAT